MCFSSEAGRLADHRIGWSITLVLLVAAAAIADEPGVRPRAIIRFKTGWCG
jgi:hypothetical protein